MITILHLTWGLELGGKERFLDQLVRGMHADRFANEIWTLRRKGVLYDRLARDHHRVRFLAKKPGLDPRMSVRLRRDILALKPDIVHAHDFTSTLAASSVIFSKGSPPVIATLHGGYLGLNPLKKRVCEALLRRTAMVTAVSEHLTAVVRGRLGDSVPVRHIPYDVDLQRDEAPIDPQERRGRMGLPKDGPLVVMVARLERPKDQASVIRAAQQVCQRMPACHFLFVGDGSQRQALMELAAKLHLADRVHFVGNVMEVSGFVDLADVCVLASFQEGLCRAIQEYMAAGKPVVASDVGGTSELIHDGEEGFLVEPGSVEALADRILHLLSHPETARAMGRKGQDVVRSRFARGDMISAYERLYESVDGLPRGDGRRGVPSS